MLLAGAAVLLVGALASSPNFTGEVGGIITGEPIPWPAYITIDNEQPHEGDVMLLGVAPVHRTADVYWDFGDGTTGNKRIEFHTFEHTGTYLVKAKITVCRNLLLCESRVLEKNIDVLPSLD